MTETDTDRPRLVGTNHVALEVGDIEEAERFYGELFEFEVRGRSESSVYLDMGDQFIALAESDDAGETADHHRHFGLVVDDVDAVERRLTKVGDAERVGGPDFRDPWGNYVQVVAYADVQFTKAEHVLAGMGLSHLSKSESAVAELEAKDMAPDDEG